MSRARPFVTVVSGLPRSGTSLAMQMLGAGGMPLLADDERKPDADNPRGYFEYAPVRGSARDTSWVADAPGKAVKVIYALLRHLPPGFEYRVLFLRRRLADVIASQERMLARGGALPRAELPPERLAQVFAEQLAEIVAWCAAQPSFRLFDVDYDALVVDPHPGARAIDAFLGGGLDRGAMAAVVEVRR